MFPVQKPKYANTHQKQVDLLMDNIWELIQGSKRYIWRQLHHLDEEIFYLLYPEYSYKFLGSGVFTKNHLKLHLKLKEKIVPE